MGTNTLVSGGLGRISAKAMASTFGKTARRMRDTSSTTLIKVGGASFMLTGLFMMASGSIIWRMGLACMCMRTEHVTKVCGRATSRTAKALKRGPTAPATKENTATARSSAMAPSNGMTILNSMAISLKTILRVTVFTSGGTIVNTKESGSII